ncbi:glycosyltransferase [Sphingomonas sp. 35-24ZXX]|uniref:glycosyltransferase n=1 Tax=Sphingomonas sp. 35-24ZXX TaxID=1545915 RepID=UPI00053BF8A2|nr:glycosyltransferase [Sphingomonas sp. 35-24ZXX]
MILATVGMQLPFPRFIRALDAIAGRYDLEIVAQAMEPVAGLPHLDQRASLSPAEFDALACRASVIAGHAGIGTILSAARVEKPIILYPRVAALGEHRNEHQLATAREFAVRTGIYVAHTNEELQALLLRKDLQSFTPANAEHTHTLISRVRAFVTGR